MSEPGRKKIKGREPGLGHINPQLHSF